MKQNNQCAASMKTLASKTMLLRWSNALSQTRKRNPPTPKHEDAPYHTELLGARDRISGFGSRRAPQGVLQGTEQGSDNQAANLSRKNSVACPLSQDIEVSSVGLGLQCPIFDWA